jgi:hypothetical protein
MGAFRAVYGLPSLALGAGEIGSGASDVLDVSSGADPFGTCRFHRKASSSHVVPAVPAVEASEPTLNGSPESLFWQLSRKRVARDGVL